MNHQYEKWARLFNRIRLVPNHHLVCKITDAKLGGDARACSTEGLLLCALCWAFNPPKFGGFTEEDYKAAARNLAIAMLDIAIQPEAEDDQGGWCLRLVPRVLVYVACIHLPTYLT